jgi:Leucine-rich repeat (LRR) protein
MKKTLLLIIPLFFLFVGCEEPTEPDTTPPSVTITSPQSGSTVSEVVSITCMSSDNEGVEKVELWVNGAPTDIIDNTEPYSLEWNTLTYDDGSYGITVRSYDTSGNTTDSELITLVVYKTVELWGVVYSVENSTSLSCQDCNLTGSIPPEIGYLTNLTYLNLDYNQLTGEIPPEIWSLTNLTYLNLGQNDLTGSIPPEIGNLTNLTYLSLRYNQLTGSIPPEIGNLTNLGLLYLSYNELTGEIPPEIWTLTNLTYLILKSNQLTGSIPSEIGNLTNLIELSLYDNQLTGEIPESICDLNINFSHSGSFNISNNQLCPPYPSCIEDYVGNQDTSDCD